MSVTQQSSNQSRFVSRLTHALLGMSLMLSAASAAQAQEAQAAQPAADEAAVDTVVVTGSRIRRTDLEGISPVAVVGEEQIRDSGNVTIENTLNDIPQFAAGQTSASNATGGSGVLSANLRGLGPQRTLVLVNGRRYISADQNGLVDLASIPDMLIDHVEVMTGGGAAVYGSDAVAGAVNFILKKNVNGIDASYFFGKTSESDGETNKIDLVMGSDFADGKGNVVAYGSYTQRDQVMFSSREFSSVPLNQNGAGTLLLPGGSGNIPGTKLTLDPTQLAGLVGVNFPASGSPGCTNLAGVRFGVGGEVLPYCDPQDKYNFAADNYLVRPLSRSQLSSLASYAFNPNVEVYSELFYIDTRNAFQQAPQSGGLNTPGANGAFVVPDYANNPILFAPVRDFFLANANIFDPDGDGTAEIRNSGRRGTETGPRHNEYERTSLNMTGGLRGELPVGEGWNWDSFYQYQRSRTDQLTSGVYSQTRIGLGADVVIDGNGNAACRVGSAFGCVPVNPFGIGSITPEAGAFVATQQTSREIFERRVAGGSVNGNLFNLPAGPVGVAAGVEWRKDSYDFLPGATDLAGEYDDSSRGITKGEFDLTEYFAEARLPLLADMPFVKELTLELAGRSSDYSNFGSNTTWKVGAEWLPLEWLRFRSAINRAVRAPSLGELFAPITSGFTGASDPCDSRLNPSAAVQAVCIQQGVTAATPYTFIPANQGATSSSGGNPDLTPEESDTLTVGTVITVPGVTGLHVALDYFDIKVDNAIKTPSAGEVLDGCAGSLDVSSVFCQAVHRYPGGQINFVSSQINNVDKQEVSGLDFQTDYAVGLPGMLSFRDHDAKLNLMFALTRMWESLNGCAGLFGQSAGCSGQDALAIPDLKAQLSARWVSGPLSAAAQARYVGKMTLDPRETVARPVHSLPAVTYLDLNFGAQIGSSLQAVIGVENVFDKQPPILGQELGGDSNTDITLYDLLGRRYFASLRMKF
jgi:iron complex outermembrane receptor protein